MSLPPDKTPSPNNASPHTTTSTTSETPASDSLSLLYIKRKRSEQPSNSSLFVQLSAKRQKVFNEFKFVTSTRDEPVKLDREELFRKYKHDNSVSDIKDKCRREADIARRNRKYNVISAARAANGAVFSAALADSEDGDDIVCNTEKMLSQKLTLDDCQPFVSNGSEEWVYDVYLCENSCDGKINSIHCDVEDTDFEPVVRERYINEYDEDSNDENYWANDYPDEESASSGDGDDSDDSDKVVKNKRYSNEYFNDELGLNRSDYLDKYLVSDTDSD